MDEETGDITIHRHVAVSDVGKSINQLQVQMQDEGAAIMGLGHTLMEQYMFDDDGRIRNLGRDRLPHPDVDGPARIEMLSDTIENEDGPGPYGAKGMSEGAVLPSRRPWPPPSATRPASRSGTCHSPRNACGARCRSAIDEVHPARSTDLPYVARGGDGRSPVARPPTSR